MAALYNKIYNKLVHIQVYIFSKSTSNTLHPPQFSIQAYYLFSRSSTGSKILFNTLAKKEEKFLSGIDSNRSFFTTNEVSNLLSRIIINRISKGESPSDSSVRASRIAGRKFKNLVGNPLSFRKRTAFIVSAPETRFPPVGHSFLAAYITAFTENLISWQILLRARSNFLV